MSSSAKRPLLKAENRRGPGGRGLLRVTVVAGPLVCVPTVHAGYFMPERPSDAKRSGLPAVLAAPSGTNSGDIFRVCVVSKCSFECLCKCGLFGTSVKEKMFLSMRACDRAQSQGSVDLLVFHGNPGFTRL